jgi:type I restriction enzyme M protein
MLDTDTKRRIDTARDILVGKVPDPKSQVEQITIALIYKFMDDMDAEAEELGGKRKFFAGEFARYGWAKLMRSGLGGHETLNLYAEAIAKMPENPGIPPLFRDIFKNAYLPYRDPETLRAFLKIIDEFTYDHSERLGDAFEYMLSVLGSQGDAGQFRTPRHIIDFIVEVVDPKKHETVLDPACGTAGFLISSYKHILKANTDEDGNSTLTPDERGRLAANFKGYDISPDMVRLSLVNMYLHGFTDPHIYEYDTLTSQDRWNEHADVILANPPFMSPKGGIKPHNRFSVQSKRSEVLFVDYIAEHLTPGGRAGIIVPEGIIFQSQTAYTQLRKMLVEEYLVAVVSLPAGVFNPYSGVKTSILILDKSLARQARSIAFLKIENDGYSLGAQRREIDKNDLPQARAEIAEYLRRLRARESVEDFQPTLGLIAPKEKIAANGDYNLSGERYRENAQRASRYPHVRLDAVIVGKPQYGSGASKVPYDGQVRYVRITDITDKGELKPDDPVSPSVVEREHFLETNDLLIARSGSVGRAYLHKSQPGTFQFAGYLIRFRIDTEKAVPAYVYRAVQSPAWWDWIANNSKTGTLTNINAQQFSSFTFPLPPLEVQKQIVAEIEGYQKVIDGARAVLDNYRPHIPINPDWPMVELGDQTLFRIVSGGTPKSDIADYWGGPIAWATLVDLPPFDFVTEINSTERTITELGLADSSAQLLPPNSVVVSTRATIGRIGINRIPLATNQGFKNIVIEDTTRAVPEYVAFALTEVVPLMETWATGGTFKELSKSKFCELRIPLPPVETQRAIVAEIEAEQALVNANRELIARMEKKIQATLARIWGEEAAPAQTGES